MEKLSNFLNTTSGTAVVISIGIAIVLILLIILITSLSKNSKNIRLIFGKKDDTVKKTPEELKQLFLSHRFFSAVKYEYVEKDFNFDFYLYDTLLEHGIKKEDQNMILFKKSIANKFLSDCLFKYINDFTRDWILTLVDEYSTAKNNQLPNYMPESTCDIIEHLVHFTKDTTELAEDMSFIISGRQINNIPKEFVQCFCENVFKTITDIQSLFSSIIYTSDTTWIEKVYEILDIYELCLKSIIHGVDSTLVIMNGQMKKYVDNLFGERGRS